MKLSDCAFLTDENIDVEVVQWLRAQQLEVFDIKEETLFGLSDQEILAKALTRQQVVVSQDSDFGTLVFRDGAQFYGMIYLRPGHQSPEVHIETLSTLFAQELTVSPPFMITAENRGDAIRFRVREL